MAKAAKQYEVHAHHWVSGSRRGQFSHSHEGGDVGHEHTNTGPAAFTIDKDEWAAATGLRGGGRKKFTKRPAGEQMEAMPWGAMVYVMGAK